LANTGPLIAITAALGNLDVLGRLYSEVLVPHEVCQEIATLRSCQFVQPEFARAALKRWPTPLPLAGWLANVLDSGEAAVIQLALNEKTGTVCIDEAMGRRIAKLSGLNITGSVGVLLRARKEIGPFSMKQALQRMKSHGVWLSDRVIAFALQQAGETP